MKATCQICAREIGNKSGVIAHHGYRRPNRGSGWQTQSCFGARRKPYEVACDAIPEYIAILERFVVSQTEARDNLVNDPPPIIKVFPQFGGRLPIEYKRPATFNAKENVERGSHSYRTYEGEHASKYREHKEQIRQATAEIKAMKERLANWKAPHEA